MDWINLPSDVSPYHGMVYLITNNITGKKYVGQKIFTKTIRRKPLKNKKRKRISIVESDYKTYYGSSETVKGDLEKYGPSAFTREVLHLTTCKWESSFLEMREQLKRGVLFTDEYLNGIIHVRIGCVPTKLREKYKNFIF